MSDETYLRRFHVRAAPVESNEFGAAMITVPATKSSLREHRFLEPEDVLALYEELRAVVEKDCD